MRHSCEDSFLTPRTEYDLEGVREAAAKGRFDALHSLIYNRTWFITERYCGGYSVGVKSGGGDGVDSLERTIHDLWHIYFQFSRHLAYQSSDQDKLVLDIVRLRGRGTLSRSAPGFYGRDFARTGDGALWDDLPFLAKDMTAFWLDNCALMGGEQRVNFSCFLAKLASTRVCDDKLCLIALLLFRNMFEDRERSLVSPSGDLGLEDPRRTMSWLSHADLLPAVYAWIREAGRNLLMLSEASWNECPRSVGEGGRLFLESEFGRRTPVGFTPWRWLFWVNRLYEIKDEAEEASEKELENSARVAIDAMITLVKEQDSEIVKAYNAERDRLQEATHPSFLKDLFDERDSLIKKTDSS